MTTASETKIVRHRLSALQLAEALGNVSIACKKKGISRTQFYEYKRRFQTHGIEGLKDLPPIHKTHPQTTPPDIVDQIIDMSIQHPMWGCQRLSDQLKLKDVCVSAPTIQNILNKNNIGLKYQRLLKLEEMSQNKEIELNADQVKAIEKANPCYRERHIESSRPGELIGQDTFYVGYLKGVGKVYMQAVVDTFGSYAFAYLHTSKQPEHSVAVIHNDVLPQYDEWGISVSAILTDNGREYCGTDSHPFEVYLSLNDIDHRKTKVRHPQTNGFVERFNRTVLDEFFRVAFRKTFYESVDALQKDLDKWLRFYNFERPHQGYRNMGKCPIDTVKDFANVVRKEA
jgi:transposase InsO family protein